MFSLEKIMSDIGLNTGGIRNKELLLGKEIISSKDKNTVEEQAKAHKGSEVIYKGNDNLWHAKELEIFNIQCDKQQAHIMSQSIRNTNY